ncbi:hypothetical protein S40285_10065 [Stachybotrys chlorohalonatus IBT 40285]|uniref:Uncharacterized protein n=1 Tax=Stachybotrys chlorohalonatus (strain IBT 40285) TaxID=1283841 RepID=A0A084QMC6_STAC4|nr:hypothetical protein S40285_10065 [Stachybotrys chlorohalonata IBT 40285]
MPRTPTPRTGSEAPRSSHPKRRRDDHDGRQDADAMGEGTPSDLQDLSHLHHRIQQNGAAMPPMPILCHEMAEIARELLHISNRMIERTSECRDLNPRLSPPDSDTSSDEDEGGVDVNLDIAAVMMVLAGYQKFYDLLGAVCAKLRTSSNQSHTGRLVTAETPQHESEFGRDGSAGRVLRVAELLGGILDRFARGQEHLTAALNVEFMNQASSGDSDDRMEDVDMSRSADGGPFGRGVMDLLEAVEDRNATLSSQVATIKRRAEEMDTE